MKVVSNLPIAVALTLLWGSHVWAQSSILISELCDPHLNYTTDRFIEIYNAASTASDLTGWSVVAVGNGGDIFTWNLSGQIDPGEALVSGDATTVTGFPVDFPDEAWSNSNGLWNGKVGDGAKLIDPIGETVDYVVVTGAAFENADYVRNYDVNTANSTYNPSEWTATPVELATDASPGSHSAAPPLQGPTISSISTVPELPVAGEGVDVTADVIDSTATITSVLLYWGVSDSSLPNEIGMSPSAGETYLTDTPIPSHSEGTTVYFQILAANDLPDTSITGLQSYSLPYYATIHEIQGESPDSPFDGEEVITHGVVTARFDNSFVIQDGSGPWNGIWVQSSDTVTLSDSTVIRGYVTESAEQGYAGNTLVVDAVLLYSSTGTSIPEPVIITTAAVSLEEYEGVLVEIDSAACTNPNAGSGGMGVRRRQRCRACGQSRVRFLTDARELV